MAAAAILLASGWLLCLASCSKLARVEAGIELEEEGMLNADPLVEEDTEEGRGEPPSGITSAMLSGDAWSGKPGKSLDWGIAPGKGGTSPRISAAAICSGVRSVGSPVCVLMCCWRTRALA